MAKLEPLKDDESKVKVIATLEDGKKLTIQRTSWEKCFKRALKLDAVQVLDNHNHLWARDERAFLSIGIQNPPGKMKRIQ